MNVARILEESCAAYHSFSSLFQLKMSASSRDYTDAYSRSSTVLLQPEDDWILDASKTGQIFPGNPIVRPSVSFGGSSRMDNTQNCRKNYRKSDTCSPGIFTVQCSVGFLSG